MTEAITARQVDLAFVAIDPVRAADMDYTAPYVIIEGAYLVRRLRVATQRRGRPRRHAHPSGVAAPTTST